MRRLALGAGLLVVAVQVPAVAQQDAPVTGYWSRARIGAPSPIEAPLPFVPEGGTWVSGNADGELAVSALRLELAEGDQATELALDVAQVQGTPQVRVCPAAAVWLPNPDGRRYDERPLADCAAGEVTATVVDGRLLVPLTGVVPAGTLDVVLEPAPGAAFSVTMQPATAESVSVTRAPEPLPGPPSTAGPSVDVVPAPVPDPLAGALLPPFDAGSAVAAPLAGAQLPATAPSAPTVEPPQAAPQRRVVARPAAAPLDDRRTTVPAVLLLAGLAALAVRLSGTPVRAPVALGGAARLRGPEAAAAVPAVVRGIGRFRRERTGAPPPL